MTDQRDWVDNFSDGFWRYRRRAWRRGAPFALLIILVASLVNPAIAVWAFFHVRSAALTVLALVTPAHGAAMCEERTDLWLDRNLTACGPRDSGFNGPPCDDAIKAQQRKVLRQWDAMNARCDDSRISQLRRR